LSKRLVFTGFLFFCWPFAGKQDMSNLANILVEKGYTVLDRSFYDRTDVTKIARDLLGKIIVTNFDGQFTAGRIVETEAYNGAVDKASHAYGNRRTARTEVMFGEPGTAYVYLCYGIHHLFNVVTNKAGIPHAVLVRALEPIHGIDIMLDRTRKQVLDNTLTRGPGNVSKALGIFTSHTGLDLMESNVRIVQDQFKVKKSAIGITTRIGVDFAGPDAFLPYRFIVSGNPYVSGSKNRK
jgi:DNA-3-methyladenine glycosylase